MIRFACILFVTAAVTLSAPAAFGEQPETDEPVSSGVDLDQLQDDEIDQIEEDQFEESSGYFDSHHRRQIYEASRLRPWRAIGYTAAFPGLGNFYAEQYALGTIAISAMVFAGMFAGFGLSYGHVNLLQIAGTIAGLTYLGSGLSSYLGVRSHNAQLRRSLHIDDDYEATTPRSQGPAIGVTVRF